MEQAWTKRLACVGGHNRASPVLVTQEMMATSDTQNDEAGVPSAPMRSGRRRADSGSCRDGYTPDADELHVLRRAFQPQFDCFANSCGDFVESGLRVAAGHLGDRSYVIS